jgi:hypothetical protein
MELARLVEVTDPAEIEAIKRNDIHDPIGAEIEPGKCVAYLFSLERYRKRVEQGTGTPLTGDRA